MKNNVELYTLHLFSGAGGGILADVLLGHTPIGAVELEPYARNVLLSRQLDERLPRFPIWDNVQTFRIDNPNTKDFIERLCGIRERLCICGGFPCQDISCAGKGEGISGKKSGLWKEYKRIICEIRPKYAFLENSNMLIRRGLDTIVSDFAEMGYSMAWGVVSAADVGAPHLRKRLWGVAVSNSLRDRDRRNERKKEVALDKSDGNIGASQRDISDANCQHIEKCSFGIAITQENNRPDKLCCPVSNSMHERTAGLFGGAKESDEKSELERGGKTVDVCRQRRKTQSRLDGMADGFSRWLDDCQQGTLWTPDEKEIPRIIKITDDRTNRLKVIGNAQVPLCAAVAFVTLKEIVDNYDN